MDADLFVHLVCGGNDYGRHAILASCERARWGTGVGRCKMLH